MVTKRTKFSGTLNDRIKTRNARHCPVCNITQQTYISTAVQPPAGERRFKIHPGIDGGDSWCVGSLKPCIP